MNSLEILYESKDQDTIFLNLKRLFADAASSVSVTEIIPDEYTQITWEGGYTPEAIATEMTAAVPTAIIEIDSTTGIDLKSRFFNKTQLY